MFRKNYLTSFLTIALLLSGALAASAQTAPMRGRIETKGADGKMTPIAGATVEAIRLDVNTKPSSATTDKKGNFAFAGLPLAVYVLNISGPGIKPEIIPNVKAGREDLVINVLPGDGTKWTEEEVRAAIANQGKGNTTQSAELTADQKKQQEEFEKKRAEVESKNEKAKKTNEIINATLKEGSSAFESKNYDVAIVKFEEGYNADPAFAGTAPVMLNNKALALISRATDSYNKSVKATDDASKSSLKESAKKDLTDAIVATDKALEVLKTATSTDANVQKNYEANKVSAITYRKNAYRLLAQTSLDLSKGKEALTAFQEYMAVETDPAKKNKAQLDLATTLQDSQEYVLAVDEFRKVLAVEPNNVDALAGLGLNLVTVGYLTMEGDSTKGVAADPAKGKEQLQEAANYLQRFVDTAPADHKLLASVKDSIGELKAAQVTPQKGKTTTTTKKKN